MARKKKQRKPARQSPRRFRLLSRRVVLTTAFMLISGAGLAVYKQNYEIEHDLSVIGNGTPTVVQIHDPQCSQCRRLRSNTDAALRRMKDVVQFRIADIKSAEGRKLARQHDVPHVTLLLFDADGELKRKIRGVRETSYIRDAVRRTLVPEQS